MSSTSTKPAEPSLGKLSVVATPIGNLDDVTLRSLATLRAADVILAEDTRRTKRLCAHHGIATPLRSFHAHTPLERVAATVEELALGAKLALVSDAGTPVISDPGIRLVAAARERGILVEAIPGPSAVTAAISIAGLRSDVFRFIGFLPRSGARRRRILDEVAQERGATVFFEAANRVLGTLGDLEARLGPRREVAVCRELTKMHEEVIRGSLPDVREALAGGVRGEVTIVVGGTGAAVDDVPEVDPVAIRERARELVDAGERTRDVAQRLAAETGISRKDAYSLVLEVAGKGST